MKLRIEFPNFNIKIEIRKNREDLLTNDAITNNGNEILNAPAVMVNILYGIGVNPAVKIIKKPYCSYCCLIEKYRSKEKPGILLKKNCANGVNDSPFNQRYCPIK